MEWLVEMSYPAKFYPDMDDHIQKTMKKYADSSGMGFGARDLTWTFKREKEAIAFAKKLQRFVSKQSWGQSWGRKAAFSKVIVEEQSY